MPYVKRTTRAGKTIEVEYFYTSRLNKKGAKRKDKVKPTPDAQKRVNTKQAERKLRLLMNANFVYGDFHLILDYIRHKGEPDRTREEMKKDIQVFLRECRKLYKKAGLEFKYIHVMEIGNRVKVFPLDDSGQYGDLAAYFIKYTDRHMQDAPEQRLQGKRWAASKNLVHPEPEYEYVTARSWYRCEAKAPAGYYVEKGSEEKGTVSPEYYGYGYYRYRLIQLE